MGGKPQIDFAKLLGFETLNGRIAGDPDFKDDTFAARLGAKVGTEPVSKSIPASEPACKTR